VNKFAEWMQSNDKKQRGVAEKLGISTSTLHDILRKGQMPSLKLAYQIEQYTKGAITLYDWIDPIHNEKKTVCKIITKIIPKKTKK
jgi:transcriptional regulator with XRE-family HTH domain